jgi:hypothetical protein
VANFSAPVKVALVAGGSFTCSVAGVLGLAAFWGLGDPTILYALLALCIVTAAGMFTAAGRLRP